MPVYEYHCDEHGPFEAMRPMAQYASPCACPVCGAESQRVMLSVPNISSMTSERRTAHATNERSSDSPKRMSTHGPVGAGGKKLGNRGVQGPNGVKAFPSSRPWMLGH